MSDELNKEIEQLKNQINGMNVQIAAAKDMIGESQNAILNLKTNISLYAKAHNDVVQENARLQAQNQVLAAKILELTPKPVESNVTLDHCVPESLEEVAA
jgi:uncharacterized coiled-coil DUF342 family protein